MLTTLRLITNRRNLKVAILIISIVNRNTLSITHTLTSTTFIIRFIGPQRRKHTNISIANIQKASLGQHQVNWSRRLRRLKRE